MDLVVGNVAKMKVDMVAGMKEGGQGGRHEGRQGGMTSPGKKKYRPEGFLLNWVKPT